MLRCSTDFSALCRVFVVSTTPLTPVHDRGSPLSTLRRRKLSGFIEDSSPLVSIVSAGNLWRWRPNCFPSFHLDEAFALGSRPA
jgi:hypothetical protein